ncbi:hypothetical protein RCJ22_18590 [Vibrio sp. FNV 38]|nr:hypothetical protein [Vibrio sp. FNV 38]
MSQLGESMYLFKNRCFVRLCTPKSLVKQGFPFDFKFSLQTKSRAIAIRRSHPIIIKVLRSLDRVDSARDCPSKIRAEITSAVNIIRATFTEHGIANSSNLNTAQTHTPELPVSRNNYVQGYEWQQEFISSKQQSKVTHLTVHQLMQRTRYFLDYLKQKKKNITQASRSDLMVFGDHLHSWNKSAKTKKRLLECGKAIRKMVNT